MTKRAWILLSLLFSSAMLAALAMQLLPPGAGHAGKAESAAATARAVQSEGIAITPHRALYDLRLADSESDSGINNAGGQLLFSWGDTCDGWTIEQRLDLVFSYTEGARQRVQTSLASWEAKDGSNFRFSVRRQVNGKDKEDFQGQAQLAADGSGAADYAVPAAHKVTLVQDSLFPSLHTLQVLRSAKAGTHLLTRDVFDGADATGYNQVTAFIGDPVEITPPADTKATDTLDRGRAWPIHMAFFAPDNNEASEGGMPDYEMSMTLLENGVAHDLKIDYGDFTVDATLRAVEPLPAPHC